MNIYCFNNSLKNDPTKDLVSPLGSDRVLIEFLIDKLLLRNYTFPGLQA